MTNIEWTDKTWNPLVGCSVVSPGCTNCYAMAMAARLERMNPKLTHYQGLTKIVNGNAVWTGQMALAPEHILTEPLRRKKPTMYFVNSMSDLFHESVPDGWIDRVFAVMALCPQHTFQVLTKRTARMRKYCSNDATFGRVLGMVNRFLLTDGKITITHHNDGLKGFQLPNVWLGVSAERQQEADARIPDLLATPAAVRFVSAEPLLSHLDLSKWIYDGRREIIPGSDRSGTIRGRSGRDDLALGEVDRGRERLGTDLHAETTCGTEFRAEGQLPASNVQGRRPSPQDFISSHCVDGDTSSTDPCFDGDQSYRRQQAQQRAVELGTDNSSAKRPALPHASRAEEERSAGDQELSGSGDRGSSAGNPLHLGNPSALAAGNCGEVRDHAIDRVRDCSAQELDPPSLNWIIVGGESGPDARPMHPDWVRAIRDQCVAAEVPFFFKQWGNWLVGERQQPGDALTYLPDVVFQDGSDFSVFSDGHDILLGGAEDEKAGPKHLWREYWGWQGHLIKPVGKARAGRLLDGREWQQWPGIHHE